MRKICTISFFIVLFCLSQSFGEHLLPGWQFSNTSQWDTFDSRLSFTKWTDGRFVMAAECSQKENTSQSHKYCECDSVSQRIEIDPRKAYEFSIYIKCTAMKKMSNYFGFFVYDKNGDKIDDNWVDPYFKRDKQDRKTWRKWTGYILPHFTRDTDSDGQPDAQSFHTNGVDWTWPRNASHVALRFGSCYYGTQREANDSEDDVRRHGRGPGKTWFMYPDVREIKPQLAAPFPDRDPRVRTFDISDPLEWAAAANYSGIAFVNGQYTPIAYSNELNEKCYYPWGITRLLKIDHKKMYEFSIWILSTASDLHNFLGFQVYDSNSSLLHTNTTDKPYFKRTSSDTNEWTRWNGFILPAKYNPDYMPSYFSNGKNWQWPHGSKYVQLRFGTCYGDGDKTGKSYFALPQVVESDLRP